MAITAPVGGGNGEMISTVVVVVGAVVVVDGAVVVGMGEVVGATKVVVDRPWPSSVQETSARARVSEKTAGVDRVIPGQ